MSIRVLITDSDLGDSRIERDLLVEHLGADVTIADCRDELDVRQAVDQTNPHAIIVQWAPITASVLDLASVCRTISRLGIGLDMIDQEAAAARGISVRNVPHYCTEEVATHAVALGLNLWRRVTTLDHELRSGTWNAAGSAGEIRRLSGSTVGIIGMGRIGRLVADAYATWGMRVLVHDPVQGDDQYERVDVATIARESDLITLHAPLLDQTWHIIDSQFLLSTAKRPFLINVSRGPLVDTNALIEALHDGNLSGAGLDVFESEPLKAGDKLFLAPNTVLTPHAAWCSSESLPELRRSAAMNVVNELQRGTVGPSPQKP